MNPEKNNTWLIVAAIAGLVVGFGVGYYTALPSGDSAAVVEEQNPLADVAENPLENVKTNPFEDVKYNPFE